MTESKQSSAPKRVAEQLQVMEYGKGGTRNSQVCSGKYETTERPCTHFMRGCWIRQGWLHLCYMGPQGRYGYVRHVLDALRRTGRIWLFEDMECLLSHRAAKWRSVPPGGKASTPSWPQGSCIFQDQPGQGLPWAPRAAWGKTGVRTAPKSTRHHSPKGNQTQVWRLREAGWCQRKEG